MCVRKNKRIIVVATDEEYNLAKKRFKGHKIIKTGVGGINVIETLKKRRKGLKITNFGYCGSNNLPIGTEVRVNYCSLHHPNCDFVSPSYTLNKDGNIRCYTNNDFVLESDVASPCVFDMELAYICALGFKDVESIKIVSDNLSLKEYEENTNEDKI